ncbi:MAG: KamA family radical SAM protein [Pirellulaceae bacterium]|nr:KamA family radical SAM protein [Pirellulaceae bacterium]
MNECGDTCCSVESREEEPPGSPEPPGTNEPPSRFFTSPFNLATESCLAVAAPPRAETASDLPLIAVDRLTLAPGATSHRTAPVEVRWRRIPVTNQAAVRRWTADLVGTPSARRSSPPTQAFRQRFFADVTDAQWDDWRWQARHRIRTPEQFAHMLQLSPTEHAALLEGGTMLPVGVTPYYMSLISPDNPQQPLRKTVVPTTAEFTRMPGEADDPLGEDGHSPVPGLVHRYPDRVLLLPLDFCSTYCRYCTRSRVVGHGEIVPNEARLDAIFDYLERATTVRDVLISGGDPLALSDERLDAILSRLRSIPHIEFVRIGTKMPAVLPQRITPQLCEVLRRYHPLWMSLHFVHPDECTPESAEACGRLADAGIPLGSQTVLLRGVNDNVDTMKQLVHRLLMMRVRPYYLYQCDPISGSSHFRTPVSKGLEIIAGLRGFTTGYAVPTYVIDAPGGGGKIPLQPDNVVGRDGDDLLLRNFEGRTFRYPDPQLPMS